MTTRIHDLKTAGKTYWAILSKLHSIKEIPAIQTLLVNGKFASDFCEKANLFNNLFCVNLYSNKILKRITIIFI